MDPEDRPTRLLTLVLPPIEWARFDVSVRKERRGLCDSGGGGGGGAGEGRLADVGAEGLGKGVLDRKSVV